MILDIRKKIRKKNFYLTFKAGVLSLGMESPRLKGIN